MGEECTYILVEAPDAVVSVAGVADVLLDSLLLGAPAPAVWILLPSCHLPVDWVRPGSDGGDGGKECHSGRDIVGADHLG